MGLRPSVVSKAQSQFSQSKVFKWLQTFLLVTCKLLQMTCKLLTNILCAFLVTQVLEHTLRDLLLWRDAWSEAYSSTATGYLFLCGVMVSQRLLYGKFYDEFTFWTLTGFAIFIRLTPFRYQYDGEGKLALSAFAFSVMDTSFRHRGRLLILD